MCLFLGCSNSGNSRSPQPGAQEMYLTTEESSEPAMYFCNESRGRPWTQYRAPTPLPPFGTEEYYRVIKSSNPSPTTTNESELGSSLEELSSGENLFFPEPPELPESPFPRRIGLTTVSTPGSGGNFNAHSSAGHFVHYAQVMRSTADKRRNGREQDRDPQGEDDNEHRRLPKGATVLKLGSAETLLQEMSEAPKKSDEDSPPILEEARNAMETYVETNTSHRSRSRRTGNMSTRGSSFHAGVRGMEQDTQQQVSYSLSSFKRQLSVSDPVLSKRKGAK